MKLEEFCHMDEPSFEAHASFADIQIMTDGAERVDVADISVLNVDEAHPDRDFWALSGQEEVQITLAPSSFLLVLPGDAHKLKIQLTQPETVTKAVFKVSTILQTRGGSGPCPLSLLRRRFRKLPDRDSGG